MRGHQITFHGDIEDLNIIFAQWFGTGDLFIAEMLGRLNECIRIGHTPEFALAQLAKPGDFSGRQFVVGPSSKTLVLDDVYMADGSGRKQRVSLANRWVVGLRLGGQTGERELQPSVLSVSGDDENGKALYIQLRKAITSKATYVGLCWLLPGAYQKLIDGWRLPRGQFQAASTDLRPEEAASPRKSEVARGA